jgi:hypothetical protein
MLTPLPGEKPLTELLTTLGVEMLPAVTLEVVEPLLVAIVARKATKLLNAPSRER